MCIGADGTPGGLVYTGANAHVTLDRLMFKRAYAHGTLGRTM